MVCQFRVASARRFRGTDIFIFSDKKMSRLFPVMVEVSNLSQSVWSERNKHPDYQADSNALSETRSKIISGERHFRSPRQSNQLYAQPFYFHINKAADLVYKWSFAGKEAVSAGSEDANLLILTIPQTSGAGRSMLEVSGKPARTWRMGEKGNGD